MDARGRQPVLYGPDLLLSIVPQPTYASPNHGPGERLTLPIGLFLDNTWHCPSFRAELRLY